VGGLDKAHYFKGLSVFLEALKNLRYLHWRAFIIGDGDLRIFYEQEARQKNLDKQVIFLGAIEEEKKPFYYRAAQIHVFPSIDRSESFGLVALEAGATGLPTIASDLPGVSSIVKDHQTGIFVKPNDVQSLQIAIERLIGDPPFCTQLGQEAHKQIQKYFTWPLVIDRLESSYENCLYQQSLSSH
jgi:glycosyltransferase involved in cell wall biosynthesis